MANSAEIALSGREVEFKAGAHLWFGAERSTWRVLDVDREQETALLIADAQAAEKPYHEKCESITWEKCTLRAWLNGEYYEKTFSDAEKAAILATGHENPNNPQYGTAGCNPTTDRIFLLSIEEAKRYFRDDKDLATGSWWWLRSPGSYSGSAAYVRYVGGVNAGGDDVNCFGGIRPAFTINLKSDLFQSFIISQSDESIIIRVPELRIQERKVICAAQDVENVKIPSGVTEIGEGAFRNCAVKSVKIPEGVTAIGDLAFSDCKFLESVELPSTLKEIGIMAFFNCPKLKLPAALYTGKKLPPDSLARFLPDDAEAIANVLLLTTAKGKYYCAAAADRLTEDNAAAVADALIQRTEKQKIKDPETVLRFALAVAPVLEEDKLEKIRTILAKEQLPTTGEWLLSSRPEKLTETALKSTVVKQALTVSDGLLLIKTEAMAELPSFSHVLAAAADYAEMYGTGRVDPKAYKKETLKTYRKSEAADRLAAAMDHKALMNVLRRWGALENKWDAPYAAFANDEELAALIDEMKTWAKEKDKTLWERVIRLRGAVLLNDTKTAMRYADSFGLLDRYAEMRGTDADSIRDNIISDFGLDENGKKSWTLGGRTITANLNPDLTLTLQDENGKILKSVPKKGAAPDEYEAVSKDFAAMKKAIRPTAKTRNDKIFADFLSGRSRPGEDWKKAYLGNPLLRMLARLIVWEQNGVSFILDADGNAQDAFGNRVDVTDEAVSVAHPMEMDAETVEAWQKYFTDTCLKQPFEQVWEPVADASLVKPGRYDGCTVPLYMLMNKEKHGIVMEGQSRITLVGCSAGLRLVEGHHDWYNNEFEVTNFRFEKYTRQVNHIVVHLDKGTVSGRIKKDDISATQWFDRFTLAQITEFIQLAQENNAVNVLAQLLEYKSMHFAEFDPMEEFTLDLL